MYFSINLDPSQSGGGMYIVKADYLKEALQVFLAYHPPEDEPDIYLQISPVSKEVADDPDNIIIEVPQ